MKTRLLKLVAFLILFLLLISCSKKNEDNIPKDIISWIKPCSYSQNLSGLAYLTVKPDNGFLVSGTLYINDSIVTKGYVGNFDTKGDTIWTKSIRIDNYIENVVYYAIQKSSDIFLIAGECSNSYLSPKKFIAWLDSQGNMTKHIVFDAADGKSINECKLFLLQNGNIYYAYIQGSQDINLNESTVVIDLLNEDGQILRSKEYPGVHTWINRLSLLEDGNMILTGSIPGDYTNYSDIVFILIDESGNEVFRRAFGSDTYDYGYSACKDHSDGYLVSGLLTYYSKSAIYPVSSSGMVGQYVSIADSIYSSASVIKPARDGGYHLIVQSAARLYFIKLGSDLKTKQTLWFDNQYPKSMAPWPIEEFFHLSDGSFAFLYYSDTYGQVILKTIPIN